MCPDTQSSFPRWKLKVNAQIVIRLEGEWWSVDSAKMASPRLGSASALLILSYFDLCSKLSSLPILSHEKTWLLAIENFIFHLVVSSRSACLVEKLQRGRLIVPPPLILGLSFQAVGAGLQIAVSSHTAHGQGPLTRKIKLVRLPETKLAHFFCKTSTETAFWPA